jgi:4-hydroxyproline epimerase
LAYLNRIGPGHHRIETPVGVVSAELHGTGGVTVANIPSYRHTKDVKVDVPGIGSVTGDIAWGGNWFYLVQGAPATVELRNVDLLTDYAWKIREALAARGLTGADGQEIDHIELFDSNGRNFVLCPGKAYDRSPCGTGTSAKLACLYADGKLQPGQTVRQESMIGSVFEGSVTVRDGVIHPLIKGMAFVNAETNLILDERDPFCWGIRR